MKISRKEYRQPFGKWITLLIALMLLGFFAFSLKTKNKILDQKESAETDLSVSKFKGSNLNIAVNSDAFKKLIQKRNEALEKGLLFSSKDDLVDADIKIDGKEFACKLRLKGDLLDHLSGERWSFRIILKDNDEWKGMNTFSIHNSKARSHTAEWLMHELFRKEGIVVPNYDFINVQLNGKNLGVYAFEHHFENQLLKENGRELGPILKHSDDGYWENVHKKLQPFPWIESSHIELFNKENRDDQDFLETFKVAQTLLNDFIHDKSSASEVFDLDLMAKYFALLDLSHAWHAAQFTNIRFYYNVLTGKLEPIAFDCFGDHLPNVNADWEAYGEAFNNRTSKEAAYAKSDVYRYHMFQDESLYGLYMTYLEKFTNPNYLNQFRNEYATALASRVAFIQSDPLYKDFKPNWETIFGKAFFTHKKIQGKSNLSLKAYRVEDSKQSIALHSFHYFPLEIIGFGNETEITNKLDTAIVLESYNKNVPVRTYLHKQSTDIDYIYYRTLGLNQLHKTKLLNSNLSIDNPKPLGGNLDRFLSLPYVQNLADEIIVSAGHHKLAFPVVIPEGRILKISAGTTIEFINNSSLISYSPIKALGSKQHPVVFYSESQNHAGLFISKTKDLSQFMNCRFVGLSNFKSNRITTKAGINIHRSKVVMDNCHFINLKSQICLAINYGEVELINSKFDKISGTAIKSKYSNLKLDRIELLSAGRNAVSIESGALQVTSSVFRNVLNRVFNFSNGAEVYAWDVNVFDSFHSIHISDESKAKFIKFWNENVKRGIEVRSNDEGPTILDLDQFNYKNIDQLYLIEQGISISVNGKTERG